MFAVQLTQRDIALLQGMGYVTVLEAAPAVFARWLYQHGRIGEQ